MGKRSVYPASGELILAAAIARTGRNLADEGILDAEYETLVPDRASPCPPVPFIATMDRRPHGLTILCRVKISSSIRAGASQLVSSLLRGRSRRC